MRLRKEWWNRAKNGELRAKGDRSTIRPLISSFFNPSWRLPASNFTLPCSLFPTKHLAKSLQLFQNDFVNFICYCEKIRPSRVRRRNEEMRRRGEEVRSK